MVLAAGLGTRLRPITHEIPKPLVPVANRPIMEHILELLAGHGMTQIVANLHWYADTIRDRFGDGSELGVELTYSYEEELLGTAGGVRNVRDFFGDEPFVVMAADALTDIDLSALIRTHERNDWIATLAVKQVKDTTEYGVVVTGDDGAIQGFQEKPEPADALSDLANCMIYVFEPEIFDHFPDKQEVDFALDVFPALLEAAVPFGVHATEDYWNDVGSLPEYLQGNLDVLTGAIHVEPAGRADRARGGRDARRRGRDRRPDPVRRWRRSGRGCAARGAAGRRTGVPDRRRGEGARVGPAGRRRGPRRRPARGCDRRQRPSPGGAFNRREPRRLSLDCGNPAPDPRE